jgi:cytoskeletal protein CcmA (bactofilin family)
MVMGPMGWRRVVLGAPAHGDVRVRPREEPGASEPDISRIERGAEMNGRLVADQSLCIEGEFRGEIESADSVFVSETGSVEGPVRARTLEIHGAVVGNVVASREVVIFATGRLHGDIETPSLVVLRGATFNGRTRMYRPESKIRTSELPDRHSASS